MVYIPMFWHFLGLEAVQKVCSPSFYKFHNFFMSLFPDIWKIKENGKKIFVKNSISGKKVNFHHMH
jgi:hypothetical protein